MNDGRRRTLVQLVLSVLVTASMVTAFLVVGGLNPSTPAHAAVPHATQYDDNGSCGHELNDGGSYSCSASVSGTRTSASTTRCGGGDLLDDRGSCSTSTTGTRCGEGDLLDDGESCSTSTTRSVSGTSTSVSTTRTESDNDNECGNDDDQGDE